MADTDLPAPNRGSWSDHTRRTKQQWLNVSVWEGLGSYGRLTASGSASSALTASERLPLPLLSRSSRTEFLDQVLTSTFSALLNRITLYVLFASLLHS